jgi:site-specific DNA recombinase
MSFKPNAVPVVTAVPKRAALYLRVSTGRQAEGDVSLPSQRDLTRRYCEAQGWSVVEEFVEPGASATDDRRPVFQRMLERATTAERNFDVICVHAFSRFYRNGAEMELAIRRLRKHGVEVISITQPTGDDPSQEMMRQIIGIFDEYTSKENGKNVTRAMRESAKQGFWNGGRPPLGYRTYEAERRGTKSKKKLEIDPVEAETISLIFKLYTEGAQGSGPLGIKETCKWLNAHGYRTRAGAHFGIGPLYRILTNAYYATGQLPFGVKNTKTGQNHDPQTIIPVAIPPIISMELYEQVRAKLADHNPRITPPRVVNGPTLLTGLAKCESCGSGMTRSGTVRRGRKYSYYSCAGCGHKGPTVCKGRHVPLNKLDTLVTQAIKTELFAPERLTQILRTLIERQGQKDLGFQQRRASLEAELEQKDQKLSRLYSAIEDGIVERDEQLKARIKTLKNERDITSLTLDRLAQQTQASTLLTPERIAAFASMMSEKVESGDIAARKAYLRAVISEVRVGDQKIQIIGDKINLQAAVAGQWSQLGKVRGFVRKWRALRESNPSLQRERLSS